MQIGSEALCDWQHAIADVLTKGKVKEMLETMVEGAEPLLMTFEEGAEEEQLHTCPNVDAIKVGIAAVLPAGLGGRVLGFRVRHLNHWHGRKEFLELTD